MFFSNPSYLHYKIPSKMKIEFKIVFGSDEKEKERKKKKENRT